MFFQIIINPFSNGKLFIPTTFAVQNNVFSETQITIHAGLRYKTADIIVNPYLGKNIIQISKDIIEYLSVPVDIQYQVYYSNGHIHLGPVIGLLFSRKNISLTPKRIESTTHHISQYSKFNGLIYIFSEQDVDFEKGLVEGYYFYPKAKDLKEIFKKGTFPLSKVIYRRTWISTDVRNKLVSLTNNNLFNSNYFDKWYFWLKAIENPYLRKYTPNTRFLTSIDDLEYMLENYGIAYLKPQNGTLGHGLVQITKSNDVYLVRGKNNVTPKKFKKISMIKHIDKLTGKGSYLIQQGINVLRFENRYTAFRVIMQKNEKMNWQTTGIVAYLGKIDGICSNYSTGWYGLHFKKFFSKFLSLNEDQIKSKELEVIKVCQEVCKMLDNTDGHYGDVGIDIGIDENLDIWIFEVNNRHFHTMPLSIPDMDMYHSVRNTPIRYAVALDGFKIFEN
jgi:hypothetical protein